MRKIFTILCIVLSYQISFGQVSTEHILTSKNYNEYASSVKVPKSVTPIWSEDFSNGIQVPGLTQQFHGNIEAHQLLQILLLDLEEHMHQIKLQSNLQPLKMVL